MNTPLSTSIEQQLNTIALVSDLFTSDSVSVTFTLPRALWARVRRLIPLEARVGIVIQAFEDELQRRRIASVDQLIALQQELRAKYGQLPDSAEDIRQMREERDAEILACDSEQRQPSRGISR
jgi:hypothetical protein